MNHQINDFSEITQLRQLITASLMAALIAVGAFVIIPVGPVPVSLQTFFVLLTGLLLSPRWAVAAVGLYLFAGIIGLPVFAGGTSGIGRIAGPTGGYLLGSLPAVGVVSWLHHLKGRHLVKTILALIIGTAGIYALGVPWLKMVTAMPWSKALTVGMLPFLLGDALKIVAVVPIAKAVRPFLHAHQS